MWSRLALVVLTLAPAALAQAPLTLWYKQPANLWVEALPIGNGHLGAMIFGRTAHERIQFNEQTVWNGEPHDYAHHGASRYLGQIRDLLFAGKQKEAEDLAMQEFMSQPLHQRAYQAFGDLLLDFPGIAEIPPPDIAATSIWIPPSPPSSSSLAASRIAANCLPAIRPM